MFRREKRREFRYTLAVALAVSLSWFARLLPRGVRYRLADAGGTAFCRLARTYHDNVADNIGHVLDLAPSDPLVVQTVRAIFRVSGRNFADLLLIPRLSGQQIVDGATLMRGSWRNLDDALALGKGVVIITGHLGAFDYVGHVLHHRGYKLTTVTGRTTARFLFDAVTYLRRSKNMRLVEATPSGVRQVYHALKRGECAVFVTDRDFFQNGKPVVFFGETTTLPPGAVRIARDTGARIVPVFATRLPDGVGISIGEGFSVSKSVDMEADIREALDRMVRALEQAIAATPDQWVMFQRVWPAQPPEPVRVFPIGSPLESELLERVDEVLSGTRRRHPPG